MHKTIKRSREGFSFTYQSLNEPLDTFNEVEETIVSNFRGDILIDIILFEQIIQ
jgi:hypothetical protein